MEWIATPLNCFRGLKTRMDNSFHKVANLYLPSFLPSKTDRFNRRGRCTRFARRLLFLINRQLSSAEAKAFGLSVGPSAATHGRTAMLANVPVR